MRAQAHKSEENTRLRFLCLFFLALALWVLGRLFVLQVIEHDYYALFASNNHEIYRQLQPERGKIFFTDSRTGEEYPAAVNRPFYLVYAVPTEIPATEAPAIAAGLAVDLGWSDPNKIPELQAKLLKAGDPYEVVDKKIPEATVDKIKAAQRPGIYFAPSQFRFYPEQRLGSGVLGFTTLSDQSELEGQYGIEGYFDKQLAGKGGFLWAERGARGSWITLGKRDLTPAENGADVVLTIDRTLEQKTCERLQQGLLEYGAKSAALVLMNPATGAILAMCSLPDFDPNNYSQASDLSAYNNTSIFTPYEPGSIFKPITMAAALDLGQLAPETTFTDPCERKISGHTIHNALNKCYGLTTMTNVLVNSINTGMVWVEEKIGTERFRQYVEKFGFGKKVGITLNTETAGDISSLSQKPAIYAANGSFGQGLTVTPLQMAMAYGAIANEGVMMKPYIVKETRQYNGAREVTKPGPVDSVISPRTAKLLTGMLTAVVSRGESYRQARLSDYYIAGKTGTAQIPGRGGYSEDTNHTFAGFAPATDPAFVLIVKFERPDRRWAESTAAPVFRDIMKFALEYYGIPKER